MKVLWIAIGWIVSMIGFFLIAEFGGINVWVFLGAVTMYVGGLVCGLSGAGL